MKPRAVEPEALDSFEGEHIRKSIIDSGHCNRHRIDGGNELRKIAQACIVSHPIEQFNHARPRGATVAHQPPIEALGSRYVDGPSRLTNRDSGRVNSRSHNANDEPGFHHVGPRSQILRAE
jgi:hypothetical protein